MDRKFTTLVVCYAAVIAIALGAITTVLPGTAAATAADENPLHIAMEKMDDALKALRKQITDTGKNDSSLKLIDEMQTQAIIAKAQVPERAGKETDKAKFMTTYRLEMLKVVTELVKLETALLEGKNEEAMAIAKGLTKVKNEGHEKFQVE